VDLGNIPAGELHQRCCAMVGSVGRNQDLYAGCLGLGKGIREICDLIAGRLATVGIGKVTIRYEQG